jgi:hypothetical protein
MKPCSLNQNAITKIGSIVENYVSIINITEILLMRVGLPLNHTDNGSFRCACKQVEALESNAFESKTIVVDAHKMRTPSP